MSRPQHVARRHRRFPVAAGAIEGNAEFSCPALISDISIAGISIRTDRKLDIGRQYAIRLMDESRDISCKATVVWSGAGESAVMNHQLPDRFLSGLKYLNLDRPTATALFSFIEAHLIAGKAPEAARGGRGFRCCSRFALDARETALLEIPQSYVVRLISLGGILIQSDESIETGSRFSMKMTLQDGVQISFVGRVASSQPSSETEKNHDIGIAFVEMGADDRKRLQEVIREFYLKDSGFLH